MENLWTIPLGKNIEDYLRSYQRNRMLVGQIALAAFSQVRREESFAPAKLVKMTNVDVGLDNNAPVAEIIRRVLAANFRLKLCRLEVALSLRKQYASQARGEVWWTATEPLISKYGPGYFAVGHDSRGLWICFGCGGPSCWWGRMRERFLSPAMQEKFVSMKRCECPWSRRGNDPISVIFEQND